MVRILVRYSQHQLSQMTTKTAATGQSHSFIVSPREPLCRSAESTHDLSAEGLSVAAG